MTMEYKALDDGGQSWEWEAKGWHFQAVAVSGSPAVTLYYRAVGNPAAYPTVSHERQLEGRDARTVAEEMFRDTTEAPLDITALLRIKHTWYVAVGEHEGKYGVGLDALYLTHDELGELRTALGEVD